MEKRLWKWASEYPPPEVAARSTKARSGERTITNARTIATMKAVSPKRLGRRAEASRGMIPTGTETRCWNLA